MHMLLCAFILSHFIWDFCVADVPGSGKGESLHWQDGEEPHRLSRWVRGISSTFLWNITSHAFLSSGHAYRPGHVLSHEVNEAGMPTS